MAYYHIIRDADYVTHDMARWVLEAQATITFWDWQVCEDMPRNQLQDVYKQQGMKP